MTDLTDLEDKRTTDTVHPDELPVKSMGMARDGNSFKQLVIKIVVRNGVAVTRVEIRNRELLEGFVYLPLDKAHSMFSAAATDIGEFEARARG
jgi:hypothetical protein